MSRELQEVGWGALFARTKAEKVPFGRAMTISDCVLDRDVIEKRPGYRAVHDSPIGSSGDAVQLLARFRPSPTSARAVLVQQGGVRTIVDPTSETASDGLVSAAISSPFASTAAISAAQHATNLYLGTDEASVAWRRMKSDYTLESLDFIGQGGAPSIAPGGVAALAWTAYTGFSVGGGTIVEKTAGIAEAAVSATGWIEVTPTAADDWIYMVLSASSGENWTGCDWIAVAVSPNTQSAGGMGVDIEVALQTGGVPGTFYPIGSITDTPQAGGSENLIFCDIRGLNAATRAAVKYVRFVNRRTTTTPFAVYGHLALPTPPLFNPQDYRASVYRPSTGQESALSEVLSAVISDAAKQPPPYPDVFYGYGAIAYTGTTGALADPLGTTNVRVYNRGAGLAMPTINDIGAALTIRVPLPASAVATDVARLWKQTENGLRLCATATLVTTPDIDTNHYVDIVDRGGIGTLANTGFKATGTPPRTNCLCEHGGRLIAGYGRRWYVSSFIPTSATSNPYPQFPDIPVIEADGWSFDIGSEASQAQAAVSGDVAYLITNEAAYYMPALAGLPVGANLPQLIFRRGAVGRRAAIYAEDTLFVGSWDGLYAGGRQGLVEMSAEIRRYWLETFAPDQNLCLAYSQADRTLLCYQDAKVLRFCFTPDENGRPVGWSTGTLAHSVRHAAWWKDAGSTTEQSASSDFVFDSFTGTSADRIDTQHVGETGATWTINASGGIPQIDNTGVRLRGGVGLGSPTSGVSFWLASGAPPSADYTVEVSFTVPLVTNEMYLIARRTASNTYYRVSRQLNITQMSVVKTVAGVDTLLGASPYTVAAIVAGQTLVWKLSLSGSTLTLTVDGTVIATITDSGISAAGTVGFGLSNFSGTGGFDTTYADANGAHINYFRAYANATVSALPDKPPQLWLYATSRQVVRWQKSATSDMMIFTNAGTAIPAWVYQTGYEVTPIPTILGTALVDADGDVTLTAYKNEAHSDSRATTFTADAEEEKKLGQGFRSYKFSLKIAASASTVTARRLMWSREGIEASGA